jgi:hypothetical protein
VCLPEQIYHQRSERIMAQGALPFKYEEEIPATGMTALGGLPAYMDLAYVAGLFQLADEHLAVCTAG